MSSYGLYTAIPHRADVTVQHGMGRFHSPMPSLRQYVLLRLRGAVLDISMCSMNIHHAKPLSGQEEKEVFNLPTDSSLSHSDPQQ